MGIEAWLMDDSDADQRLEHHRKPPELVSEDYLAQHGVVFWNIDIENFEEEGSLYNKIKEERGYNYEDEVEISKEKLPNYEQKIKSFFEEHIHLDEEIRFCLAGSGYFDLRDFKDRWVRIKFAKGCFFVLPAGIYHRFTLDTNNYVKVKRLFIGEPVWTPYNRPADDKAERQAYLQTIADLKED